MIFVRLVGRRVPISSYSNGDGTKFNHREHRIDLLPDTDNEVEIIDYKSGKFEPSPDDRSKQLLLYAHGFNHLYPDYVVRRLTLDMFAKDKPRVYELQDDWNYTRSRVKPLNLDVIEEMAETAGKIAHDYEHGFEEVGDESVCKDCGYWLYCGD